jgi:tetratricopeptide (TPR) repeat protein
MNDLKKIAANGMTKFVMLVFFSLALVNCKTAEETEPVAKVTNPREQFKTLFHEAMSEKMIGNYDKAILLFEQCLTLENQNGAVYFALSDLYKIQGNAVKAIQNGLSAYQTDNTNKWYALNLAQLYYMVGEYKKSADYFDIALDEEEQNLELKYMYAEVLIASKQYEKAIEVINDIQIETGKIVELTVVVYDLYNMLGETEKANAEISSLLDENKEDDEVRIKLGVWYYGQDKFEEGKKLGEELMQIHPEHGEGYFLAADGELRMKNTQKAFDLYAAGFGKADISLERKLEIIWSLSSKPFERNNPDAKIAEAGLKKLFDLIYDESLQNETLHTYYGSFLMSQGNTREALKQFKIVCNLNASDFTFWSNLLMLENDLNAFEDLYTDAQKALELFPSQPVFYKHAGVGAYETGRFDAAEEFLILGRDLVVNNNELLADFYTHLGIMYCYQKKYSEGYAQFEQAKIVYSSGVKVYGIEVIFLLEENKIQQAEAAIQVGLSINPEDAVVLHSQGLIYIRKKEYSKALSVFERAVMYDIKNGEFFESYGDALFLTGEKEKAFEVWSEAQKLGNNSPLLEKKIANKNYYEN